MSEPLQLFLTPSERERWDPEAVNESGLTFYQQKISDATVLATEEKRPVEICVHQKVVLATVMPPVE